MDGATEKRVGWRRDGAGTAAKNKQTKSRQRRGTGGGEVRSGERDESVHSHRHCSTGRVHV